jgi:hypothetical protein
LDFIVDNMSTSSSTSSIPTPKSSTNQLVGPMLTDFYQITMAYAYWKGGRADDDAGEANISIISNFPSFLVDCVDIH